MPKNINILETTGLTFTVIPNYFLDQIAPNLSASELRVMLYIYRHTLGYQKFADCLSYDQFLNGVTSRDGRCIDLGAKVSRGSLVGALASLEAKGLIQRLHSRGRNKVLTTTFKVRFNTFPNHIAEAPNPVETGLVDITQDSGQEVKGRKEKQATSQSSTIEQSECEQSEGKSNPTLSNVAKRAAQVRIEVQKMDLEQPKFIPEEVQKTILTKETTQNQKEINRAAEAIRLILERIPSLTHHEATRLVDLALSENHGRDTEYIRRLVEYVSSNPVIHTPAAVLTALIKTNQDRTLKEAFEPSNQPRMNSKQAATAASYPKKATNAPGEMNKRGPIDFSRYLPGGKYGYLFSTATEGGDFPE
jgi:hypothetical protein